MEYDVIYIFIYIKSKTKCKEGSLSFLCRYAAQPSDYSFCSLLSCSSVRLVLSLSVLIFHLLRDAKGNLFSFSCACIPFCW